MTDLPIHLHQQRVAFERDERSYKTLFVYFYNPLLHFANSLVKVPEVSEEIVSDVMLNLWLMKENVANIANLQVYLYKATKNRAINHLTRNKKYTTCDIEGVGWDVSYHSYSDSPEEIMLAKEVRKGLATAIKVLPPKCQMVYKLVKEDGLSYKEVANVMEISENTVDRHLNNALHKLVKAVKHNFSE